MLQELYMDIKKRELQTFLNKRKIVLTYTAKRMISPPELIKGEKTENLVMHSKNPFSNISVQQQQSANYSEYCI